MAIPTDEKIIQEIRSISKTAPHLMCCSNCIFYSIATSECSIMRMKLAPFVRGCNGKHFVAAEEMLLKKVKDELTEQQNDFDKVENLLSLGIVTAHASTCFLEDLARRIKLYRKDPRYKNHKSDLHKDLIMTEQVLGAMEKISDIAEDMMDVLHDKMEEIDKQYRIYVEPNLNKLFNSKKTGFDIEKSESLLNNSMEICRLIGKFVKGCIGNEKNYEAVFDLLDRLENATPYAITHKDLEHYKLKA